MRKAFIPIALLVSATAIPIAANAANPVPESATLLTDPVWKTRPDERELKLYYPERAFRMGMSGFAVITCTVDDVGKLANCETYGEQPRGQAFGIALTKIAKRMQMEPISASGAPTSGRTIRLGARYKATSSVNLDGLIVELVTVQQ